ncbi:MAG: MFS transporter [Pseudomonadota bacterium]
MSADFKRLGASTVFSSVSFGGDFVLLGWAALEIGGSVDRVGIAFAIYYLPMLLLGVPAGGIADRFGRFQLLRSIECLIACALVILALIFAAAQSGFWQVVLFALAVGGLRALYFPTRLSYTYDLAGSEQARAALAGMNVAVRLGMIPGTLLVGWTAEHYGMSAALLLMAMASLCAFVTLGRRPVNPTSHTPDPTPIVENLRQSLIEVTRNRLLGALILITALVEIFGYSFATMIPSLEAERLDIGVEALGWINAAQAAGGGLAGIALFLLPPMRRVGGAFFATVCAFGLCVIVLGASYQLTTILLVMAMLSATVVVWDVFTQTMMQHAVPEHLRGRAMGAWVVAIGCAPLGHLEIGFLALVVGSSVALYLNGAVVVLVAIAFLVLTPALRRL